MHITHAHYTCTLRMHITHAHYTCAHVQNLEEQLIALERKHKASKADRDEKAAKKEERAKKKEEQGIVAQCVLVALLY